MTIEEFAKEMNLDKETKDILELYLSYRRQAADELRSEGMSRAKARGVKFGRPRVDNPKVHSLCRRYTAGELTLEEAAQLAGVSRSTIWRRAREYARQE